MGFSSNGTKDARPPRTACTNIRKKNNQSLFAVVARNCLRSFSEKKYIFFAFCLRFIMIFNSNFFLSILKKKTRWVFWVFFFV